MLKKIKENFQNFIILWSIIILINQIFIFGACFATYCLIAALPHTGFISGLIIFLINKDVSNKNSEECLFSTGDLKVYSDNFIYLRKTYLYKDVSHINIKYTEGYFDRIFIVINNNEVLEIIKPYISFSNQLLKACNYIVRETFIFRLKFYTQQLKERGYFNLEECIFYNKEHCLLGTITEKTIGEAKVFGCGKIVFEDKEMTLFNADISDERIMININSDNYFTGSINSNYDVISLLIKFILKNSRNSFDYKNKNIDEINKEVEEFDNHKN